MNEYNNYKYKIEPCEVEIATHPAAENPEYKTGYTYTILDVWLMGGDEESSEWYDTESEAAIAAEEKIDELNEGREPDYDVQPYGEINWEERRRMGE